MRLPLPIAFALLLCASPVHGVTEAGIDDPRFRELAAVPGGRAALGAHLDGLPGVAVRRLRLLDLGELAAPSLHVTVRHLLVENLVRDGQHVEALKLVEDEELPFWRAIALAGTGNIAEAAIYLDHCARDPGAPYRRYAALTLASLENARGNGGNAMDLLEGYGRASVATDPQLAVATAEVQLQSGAYLQAQRTIAELDDLDTPPPSSAAVLRAEALLRSGDAAAAVPLLEATLAAGSPIPYPVRSRATLLLADAKFTLSERAQAESVLKTFVESAADGHALLLALDRLSDQGAFVSQEGLRLLNAWAGSSNSLLATTATFFLAEVAVGEVRLPDAAKLLEPIAVGQSPVALRAKLLLIRLHVADRDNEAAASAIAKLKADTADPAILARIEFVQARAQYADGEFGRATESFVAAADDPSAADQAAYNAALAALKAGDEELFQSRLALLPELRGESLRADLLLERALMLAEFTARGPVGEGRDPARDARAREALNEFIRSHPNHPKAAEAHLAIASLHLVATFPLSLKSMRDALAAAREGDLTDTLRERADYLAYWIEETGGEPADAVNLADAYLKAWPDSPRAPEIRMSQAEIHFRNGDYLDARLKFEKLEVEHPDSPLADDALFFAGRAAMLTLTNEGYEKALALWQKLVQKESRLALSARLHQAQLKLRQGQQSDAVALLDDVLKAKPEPPKELQISCLLLKGEALSRPGSSEPTSLAKAIETFREAKAIKGISMAAYNETLFREGKAHEAAGNITAALECYHSVVNPTDDAPVPDDTPEYRWYYSAGFQCIRLLRSKNTPQSIDAAIVIADKLTRKSGPRAADARKEAQQLSLENFRWR